MNKIIITPIVQIKSSSVGLVKKFVPVLQKDSSNFCILVLNMGRASRSDMEMGLKETARGLQ